MPQSPSEMEAAREAMVRGQLMERGIRDQAVLQAMRQVRREEFVPAEYREHAYDDSALPIGEEQTISQPFVVALMLQALELKPEERALEVGTGSGYAAAVLSRMAAQVYSVERNQNLARGAAERLKRLGFDNVHVLAENGTLGLPEYAPYDAIMLSAGAPEIPAALLSQLAPGGRLVGPVGNSPYAQELVCVRRDEQGHVRRQNLGPVHFVPLVGEQGWPASIARKP
jgi:protein-L-isoaspartate(D-aspartate) O-methyltransferase